MFSFKNLLTLLLLIVSPMHLNTRSIEAELQDWKSLYEDDLDNFIASLSELKLHGQTFDSIAHMYLIGRHRDLTKTESQQNFSPQAIEKIKNHVQSMLQTTINQKSSQRIDKRKNYRSPKQKTALSS